MPASGGCGIIEHVRLYLIRHGAEAEPWPKHDFRSYDRRTYPAVQGNPPHRTGMFVGYDPLAEVRFTPQENRHHRQYLLRLVFCGGFQAVL